MQLKNKYYCFELYCGALCIVGSRQSEEGPRHWALIAKQITAIHRHFGLHLAG